MAKKLSRKQRSRFFKIRKEQGAEAAKAFRDGIISGKAAKGQKWDPALKGWKSTTAKGAIEGQFAGQDYIAGQNFQDNRFNWTDPYGNTQSWSQDEDGNWTLSQDLSPEQQAQFDQMNQMQQGYLDQINAQGAYDTSGISAAQWQGFEGLPGVEWQNQDFSADRQRIEDELYGRYSDKLGEEWGRRREDFMQTLADRGIAMGSEGWNRELDSFDDREGQAYDTAMTRAIESGGAEQQRMFGMSLQDLGAQMDVRNLYGGERIQDFQMGSQQEQQALGRYNQQFWSPYQQMGQMQGFQGGIMGPSFGAPYTQNQPFVNVAGTGFNYWNANQNRNQAWDLAQFNNDAWWDRNLWTYGNQGQGGGGGGDYLDDE
jgi:hypothetical protein